MRVKNKFSKTMKIKAPFTSKDEVAKLCKAGADELFCGIEPLEWRKKYKGCSINQRINGSNFSEMRDLADAIKIAHQHNVKVHVTMNAFYYSNEQYEITSKLIKDILDMDADGFIFADIGLLLYVNKRFLRNKDVVIGTDAVIFNSAAVNFYRSFGATRIVFPRAMTFDEMRQVVEKRMDIEYEVFIINDLCFFVDGLCTYCKEASGERTCVGKTKDMAFFSSLRVSNRDVNGECHNLFTRRRIVYANKKHFTGAVKVPHEFTFWDKKNIQGCGACALYDFKKMGITSVKVLDRNLSADERVTATMFINKCLCLLNSGTFSRMQYAKRCKELFYGTFKTVCTRYDCYYPSPCLEESRNKSGKC